MKRSSKYDPKNRIATEYLEYIVARQEDEYYNELDEYYYELEKKSFELVIDDDIEWRQIGDR